MLCLHQVLSLLLPLRYSLVDIGGSWAQRQVVVLTAIQAAIKGKQHMTALALVAELKVRNRPLHTAQGAMLDDIAMDSMYLRWCYRNVAASSCSVQ